MLCHSAAVEGFREKERHPLKQHMRIALALCLTNTVMEGRELASSKECMNTSLQDTLYM